MKFTQHPHFRYMSAIGATVGAGGITGQLVTWDYLPPAIATASAAATTLLACIYLLRSRAGHADTLATQVGQELDHIMIGAAETSYFVDTIKKKIDRDVESVNAIANHSMQNAAATEQIAANAERASSVAEQAQGASVTGRSEVDRSLKHIEDARRDAENASQQMTALKGKAARIRTITQVINEISARTNLLALNAAIEAARAGEHGRGAPWWLAKCASLHNVRKRQPTISPPWRMRSIPRPNERPEEWTH